LLAKRKEVEKDVAVGCNVLASEDDTEISLAENVSPLLMNLYREEELTLEQLMAFAVSDDHAAQEAS
jgi:ParB family transcriptional regulator, chromosome partitioning protein